MAHAATMDPMDRYEHPLTPGWGKLMMWIFLCSDAMSFAGLLAAYGAVRLGQGTGWPIPHEHLDVPLTALNTFILICSSVTMVKALSAIRRGDLRGLKLWLLGTIIGGSTFLGIQAYEWTHQLTQGLVIQSSLFWATFYILTGFHGCHVLSGVIYLACILVAAQRGRYSAAHNNPVEIVGLYWHFVDLIWILVFTFVYLL